MGRYKFNKEKLEFVEVKRGVLWWCKKVIKYLVVSVLLALLYYFLFSLIYNTDYESQLAYENRLMEQEYGLLQEKLEVLDNTISNLRIKDREIYRSIFNAEPPALGDLIRGEAISVEIDTTHSNRLSRVSENYLDRIVENAGSVSLLLDDITAKVSALGESARAIPSIVPLRDFSVGQSGASVGKKINPFYKTLIEHTGMDLLSAIGTEVLASGDGVVENVRRSSRNEGNSVIIDHKNGYKTLYSHLGDILVRRGEKVRQGSVIARVGNTGMSFAPHLHYEIILRDSIVDPGNYFFATLSHEQYYEVLTITSNTGQSLD